MQTQNKQMVSGISLVDQRRLVVEASTKDQLLQMLEQVTFIKTGLAGGGICLLPDGVKVPVLGRRLEELHIQPGSVGVGEERRDVQIVDLPEDWNRIWNHVEALQVKGRSRNARTFLRNYLKQLWSLAGKKARTEILQTQWGPGIQAQADTLPHGLPGHVYLSPSLFGKLRRKIVTRTLKKAQEKLERRFGDDCFEIAAKLALIETALRKKLGSKDLEFINERFPVAGKEGARWVRVRMSVTVPRESLKIFHNAADLQLLLGGDTDGDLDYIAGCKIRYQERDRAWVDQYPYPELFDERPVDRIALQDAVRMYRELLPQKTRHMAKVQVLSACIKDITGILTYVFHVLARGAAHKAFTETSDLSKVQRVYQTAFRIYFPLIEEVMDARKKAGDEGLVHVRRIAAALEAMLEGEELDAGAFALFTTSGKVRALRYLYERSERLGLAQRTVGGRLLAAGRKKDTAIRTVCEELLKEEGKGKVLQALQEDLLFRRLHLLPEAPEKKEDEDESDLDTEEQPGQEQEFGLGGITQSTTPAPQTLSSLLEAFTSVLYTANGQQPRPIFVVQGRKGQTVTFKVLPWWKVSGTECRTPYTVTLTLPSVAKASEEGHRRVSLPGEGREYLFRPVFRLTDDGRVALYDARNDLRLGVHRLIQDFIPQEGKRSGKLWSSEEGMQAHLTRLVRNWVHGLEESNARRDLVNLEEFRIEVPGYKNVQLRWDELAQVLDHVQELGYDISATGKGTPGDRCSKGDEHGYARWGYQFNPFWRFGNWTRHNQLTSGIKDAIALQTPRAPRVQLAGHALPECYQDRVTVLNVALFNCNLNQFPDHQGNARAVRYDTILATPLAVELLRVKEEHFDVEEGSKQEFLQRLADLGVPADAIRLEERHESLGDVEGVACVIRKYRIVVQGGSWDEGKIASLIGPMKGVLTVIPFRLFTVSPTGEEEDVHLVWESQSAHKKLDPAMLLAMACGKAGLAEIDPGMEIEEVVELAAATLERKGYDPTGIEEVWVEANGRRWLLGQAFVGPLPIYRTEHTERATCRLLGAEGKGLKVETHAQLLLGREVGGELELLGHPDKPEQDRQFFHLMSAVQYTQNQLVKQGGGAPQREGQYDVPPAPREAHTTLQNFRAGEQSITSLIAGYNPANDR
jgi:hypothetical protein